MYKMNTSSIFEMQEKLHLPLGKVALGTAIVAVVVLSGLVIASKLGQSHVNTIAEESPTVTVLPRRELPPEWQWQPKGVEYKHMYRNGDSGPKLDWIRNGEASFQSSSRRR